MSEIRRYIFILSIAALLGATTFVLFDAKRNRESYLTVAFLDVGQGDAIFIESPTGVQMLIDGGYDRSVLRELGARMGISDRSIDVVLATHADADHIGGLTYVLERYEVGTLFYSEVRGDSPAYAAFETIAHTVPQRFVTKRGTIIDLGGGAYVRVLFPDRRLSPETETNLSSAIVEVVLGDVEFLLTGDAPDSIEQHVVTLEGAAIQSDVLKAGHHGSKTSSSKYFVDAVRPGYAVISAGKDNRYGHPHPDVMKLFSEQSIPVHATYEEGTITFETDGKNVWTK